MQNPEAVASKIDMIAVPDYPKDEVANWGLLKFSKNICLWLNEAVAQFLKLKAVDSLYTDWKIDEQFIPDDILPALREDDMRARIQL